MKTKKLTQVLLTNRRMLILYIFSLMLASTASASEKDKTIEELHAAKITFLAKILDAQNKIPLEEPLAVDFYPIDPKHDCPFSDEETTTIIGFFHPRIISPHEKAKRS